MQGIYYIKNTETGTIYIGKTNDTHMRRIQHFSKLRTGEHGNKFLQADFDKFGEAAFEFGIVEETDDLDDREVYWIQHYYANSYNIKNSRPPYVSKMKQMPSILRRVRRRGIEQARNS